MKDTQVASRPTALVLAGGNSLGAFQAGAYRTLHQSGLWTNWVIGVSIGAVNGAVIAGNPAESRVAALRAFWSEATLAAAAGWGRAFGTCGNAQRLAGQAQAMFFGNPAVFVPSYPGMIVGDRGAAGIYDLTPLRRTLERLVDFELLNSGDVRFSAVAVDLETGDEVLFDTRDGWVGPEHIMASCALIPEFRPVEIRGRLLGDGGLSSNLPLDVVRREPDRDRLCIAIDLFGAEGQRFNTLPEAAVRRQEIIFANQSRRLLEAVEREDRLRRMLRQALGLIPEEFGGRPEVQEARGEAELPCMETVRLVWTPGDEVGIRHYDYSDEAVTTRWLAGERAAAKALRALAGGEEWSGPAA